MQAVILTAGISRRMYPFNSDGPKATISLFGKSFLEHTLEALKMAKFTEVILVVGKDSLIQQTLSVPSGLKIIYLVQEKTNGMGDALLLAKPYLHDSFFLLSGYHFDIVNFAKDMVKLQKNADDVVMLTKKDTVLDKYGVLEVIDGKVVSVTEKPTTPLSSSQRAVAIYLLSKKFLSVLYATPPEHYHLEKALHEYAKLGYVFSLTTEQPTLTLKHPWDLLSIKDYVLATQKRFISPKAKVAKSAIVEGNVVISDDVVVMENACIKGPCFLGKGVIVGNNAVVRNGVVAEEGAVIGSGLEIKNSILMTGATTHSGFIGDSIIGTHSRIAGEICTANVRFNRKEIVSIVHGEEVNTHKTHFGAMIGNNVDTGVRVTTMPGICIGNSATIGPGTMVMENVQDNTLFYSEFKTVKKVKKPVR